MERSALALMTIGNVEVSFQSQAYAGLAPRTKIDYGAAKIRIDNKWGIYPIEVMEILKSDLAFSNGATKWVSARLDKPMQCSVCCASFWNGAVTGV